MDTTVTFYIYLPDIGVIAFMIAFLALYIVIRTAIKITPFIG